MEYAVLLVVMVVVLALFFEVTDGFHDTVHAMATARGLPLLPSAYAAFTLCGLAVAGGIVLVVIGI